MNIIILILKKYIYIYIYIKIKNLKKVINIIGFNKLKKERIIFKQLKNLFILN